MAVRGQAHPGRHKCSISQQETQNHQKKGRFKDMNAVKHEVEALVGKELQSANEHFPLFNSVHEAYAVILEEVQESRDAGVEIEAALDNFWAAVRGNNDMNHLTHPIDFIREQAVQMAVEAIQVAAMCDKFNISFVADSVGGA